MTTALPIGQPTTSELAREIKALEEPPDRRPPDPGQKAGGRLRALHAERDGRARLAARLAETAGQYHGDDEPW